MEAIVAEMKRAAELLPPLRMLTKSTDCRPLKRAARQGGKPVKKGVYPVVNDRILQAKPTQQAENPSAFLHSEGFSVFVAFVSGLIRLSFDSRTVFHALGHGFPQLIRPSGQGPRRQLAP